MSGRVSLAASMAHVWRHCAGSPAMTARTPDIFDRASRERGTAAHWVAQSVLMSYKTGEGQIVPAQYIGQTSPNHVIIDEEIVAAVEGYVSDILIVCNETGGLQRLRIEHEVEEGNGLPGGVVDASLFDPTTNTQYVWDLKTGHRPQSARECEQLIIYAAHLIRGLEEPGEVKLDLRIAQPFSYKTGDGVVESWCVIAAGTIQLLAELRASAEESQKLDALCTTGAHCASCPARTQCKAAQASNYAAMDYIVAPQDINEMGARNMRTERDLLDRFISLAKQRKAGIDQQLEHLLKDGKGAESGLCLEAGHGKEVWTEDDETVTQLAAIFGVDARKTGLKTPNQVKSEIPAELKLVSLSVLNNASERKAGRMQLVSVEDSRSFSAFSK